MELWVCGFNAWGQLSFQETPLGETGDLNGFQCILEEESIEVVRSSVSAILVDLHGNLKEAGCPDELIQLCLDKANALSLLTMAGNDKVVEAKYDTIFEYDSLEEYISEEGLNIGLFEEISQIVSNQTTFTALTRAGKVYTWGDGRYESCLGREISEENPANLPCEIEDLSDLPTGPIRKISSGGYVAAALTTGNDLYIWGGRPGQPKVIEEISRTPMPVDLEGQDVIDVAVGMNHMLALSSEYKLFVVGEGGNGQLGLDVKKLGEWREVVLPLKEGQKIVSVYAGYKNSFVIVDDIH